MCTEPLSKISRADLAIDECRILDALSDFSPTVVSTIHAMLDIEESDIDIVCTYVLATEFLERFKVAFRDKPGYYTHIRTDRILGRFLQSGFVIEVYAEPIPLEQQYAYRHYQIMKRLSDIGGVSFRGNVRKLKRQGIKTEPAIATLLELDGDPYDAVLEVENWSDEKIQQELNKCKVDG